MIPKRDSSEVSDRQSDMHSSWIYSRDHKALLRSTGHLFKDGRWEGQEDDFFTYREEELPILGSRKPFTFPSYEAEGIGDFPGSPRPGNFRVCVTRGFDSSRYYGSIADSRLPAVVEPDFGDLVLELNALGTDFIVRNRPGNPIHNLGQFLGELRDLPKLPHFLRTEARKFKQLGSEYLNVEFGWKPFLKDFLAMYNGQQRIQRAYEKLVRNNGLSIRKRSKKKVTIADPEVVCQGIFTEPFGHLGDESKGGNSALDGIYVGGPTGCSDTDLYSFSGQCDYMYQKFVTSTTWQCGTFRYYVPDIGSDQWAAKAKTALSGGKLTPSLVWELTPWSWLVDWFANVGDIASNFSSNAVDNETLTNCFSMKSEETQHSVVISTHWDELMTFPFGSMFHVPAGDESLVWTLTETYKARHQASPFGFGLLKESFSARQWAILAALLVSRSKPLRENDQTQASSFHKQLAYLLK